MESIKEPKIIDLDIEMVKVDLDNPNKMSQEAYEGLKKVMKKYGYLVPIIVDKDFKIADGEHRYLIYKEFGKKTIPAYVLDIKDGDRRIIRQVMNKLRGKHDFDLDQTEFKLLKQLGDLPDLKEMITDLNIMIDDEFKREDFDKLIDTFEEENKEIRPVNKKNENWFYVEFYEDDEKFETLSKIMPFKGKGKHEIQGQYFYDLVMQNEKTIDE